MIEVQCTSCHTRYRIDEQVLPDATPTFKCSRCGHVFSFEPRTREVPAAPSTSRPTPSRTAQPNTELQAPERPDRIADEPQPPVKAAPPAEAPPAPETGLGGKAESPPQTTEEELLNKPFRDDRQDDSRHGENLSFDFHDDPFASEPESNAVSEAAPREDVWQVGEPESANGESGGVERRREGRVRRRAPKPQPEETLDDDFVDTKAAPVYNKHVTHTARFFLGLFLIVGLGCGALAILAHGAPAATADMLSTLPLIGQRFVPPITPARLVALRDIHTVYQPTKGNRTALVITGVAENVGTTALHLVQVAAALRDGTDHYLANQAVYCGNNLSTKMVGEMTPHEVDFFQKLDPPKTFMLDSAQTCSFVIVFVDPPATTRRFDLSVTKAIAGGGEQAPAAPQS
jgi:predicted Zn finger-like uncharacterized protein